MSKAAVPFQAAFLPGDVGIDDAHAQCELTEARLRQAVSDDVDSLWVESSRLLIEHGKAWLSRAEGVANQRLVDIYATAANQEFFAAYEQLNYATREVLRNGKS